MTEKKMLAEMLAMLTRIEAALGLQQNEVRRQGTMIEELRQRVSALEGDAAE